MLGVKGDRREMGTILEYVIIYEWCDVVPFNSSNIFSLGFTYAFITYRGGILGFQEQQFIQIFQEYSLTKMQSIF